MFIKFTEKLAINVDEIYTIKHDTVGKIVRIETTKGSFEFDETEYKKKESEVKGLTCIAEVTNFGLINMNMIHKYEYKNESSNHIYKIFFKTTAFEKVRELNPTIITGLDDSLKTKLEAYSPYKAQEMLRTAKTGAKD